MKSALTFLYLLALLAWNTGHWFAVRTRRGVVADRLEIIQ